MVLGSRVCRVGGVRGSGLRADLRNTLVWGVGFGVRAKS